MERKAVIDLVHRLVGAAEVEQVGRHDARAGGREHRNHLAVEVATRRVAVQAQEHALRIARVFVEVGHPQAGRGLGLESVCVPTEARQVIDAFRRGAQCVHGELVRAVNSLTIRA